jgi:5'-nucleotidase
VVDGTPVDCVKLGISALLEAKPDLVISGINRGSNLGTDVLYSGTVSAAIEGVIMGVPAVAVSLTSFERDEDYNFAARFTRMVCRQVLKNIAEKDIIVNINIPALPKSEIKGVRITRLGSRRYENEFEERQDPRGNTYYWLGGNVVQETQEKDSDVAAISEGFISITPIHFDLTDYALINRFREMYRTRVNHV